MWENEYNPIEADVIIVDEFSMVDILLLEKFLRAISIDTKIIIVGIKLTQLPSVDLETYYRFNDVRRL